MEVNFCFQLPQASVLDKDLHNQDQVLRAILHTPSSRHSVHVYHTKAVSIHTAN